MKVLLTYVFVVFLLSVWSARRGGPMRAWPVLAGSVMLTVALLSRRFI
jgi:hypothetical protein